MNSPELVRRRVRGSSDPCASGCAGIHSYTADFERWCWRPSGSGAFAIDVETASAAPPKMLARFLPPGSDFWECWTRAEAIAKLTDVPVLTLVRRHGLAVPAPKGAQVWHARYGEVVCCFAHLPSEDS